MSTCPHPGPLVRKARRRACLVVFSLCLFAAAGRSAEIVSDPAAAGRKLYRSRCAKCHRMYDPAKYSDAQWQAWMTKMGKKAKLSPEDQQTVLQYVEDALRAPAKKQAAK